MVFIYLLFKNRNINEYWEKLWIIHSALNSAMWPSYLPEDWRVCWSQGWWRVCPPSSASCSWWRGSMFHSMAVVCGGRAALSSTGSISQRACWTPAGPASPTPTLTRTNTHTQVSLTYSVVQPSLYTSVYFPFPSHYPTSTQTTPTDTIPSTPTIPSIAGTFRIRPR